MFGLRTICALTLSVLALASALAAQERPPITGIAHVTLKTNDPAAAAAFYGHDLGFHWVALAGIPKSMEFQVNERQTIRVIPDLAGDEDRLVEVAFETADAKKLLTYLSAHGVQTPPAVTESGGERSFAVTDPEGHRIVFVQFTRKALLPPKTNPDERISKRIIHAGFIVQDRAVEDKFFQDVLGFDEMWHGGPTDTQINWIDVRVPNGNDWLEYMCNVRNPSVRNRGVMNHLALGVPDVNKANEALLARNAKFTEKPKIGRDGKWQLNLYDPNQTRAELMEPAPVEKPCCSEMKPPRPQK